MDFKKFINQKINYFATHFRRRAVLLDESEEPLFEINLSFDHLSDEYMAKVEQMEKSAVMMENSTIKLSDFDQGFIKITDKDLEPLWVDLSSDYKLSFNVQGQNLTDQTLLRISTLYEEGKCGFKRLKFSGNNRITQIGAVRLAAALTDNQIILELNFHGIKLGKHGANRISQLIISSSLMVLDLGLIGNESIKYLASILSHPHSLEHIGFGQEESDPWEDGKICFQQIMRRGDNSKKIFSVNLYPSQLIKHWETINELNILCKKRRSLRVNERDNEAKAASLNPDHNKYYDPENHSLNAYKFSVKSYLTNVFGSDLDEALYFLEKQRRNSLREEAIFEITKEPVNKLILEDICTADGSIVVLAKYLLHKIEEKRQGREEV